MQTIDTNDLVNDLVRASFQACAEFAAPGDGTPVCAGCGWLDAEHDPAVAEVHTLPRRTAAGVPKRLAS